MGVAVVGLGNNDNGSDMHPTIGESAAPTLTATTIPATNNSKINQTMVEHRTTKNLNTYWSLVPSCLPTRSPIGHAS